jgi:hypothetical protein
MEYFWAIIMLCICLYTIIKLYRERTVVNILLCVIGGFSIGYYVLPIFFKTYSQLEYVSGDKVSVILIMDILFFVALILGIKLKNARMTKGKISRGLLLPKLDSWYLKRYKSLFYLCFGIWLIYYFTTNITYYTAGSLAEYEQQIYSGTNGIMSTIGGICTAIMAVSVAISYKNKSKKYLFVSLYIVRVVLATAGAQRLTSIEPLFMLALAFFLIVDSKICFKIMGIGVIFLIIISPLLNYMRNYERSETAGAKKLSGVKYESDNPILEGFIIIVQRADLIYNSVALKERYDLGMETFNHRQYFFSILCAPIPRLIFPDKPYLLSDNNKPSGEISQQIWRILISNDYGSLTAFGAITAYREGGWLWLIINGFLTGILLSWICNYLGRGGIFSKILLVFVFVPISFQQAPTSFFYLLISLISLFYLIIFFKLLNNSIARLNFR